MLCLKLPLAFVGRDGGVGVSVEMLNTTESINFQGRVIMKKKDTCLESNADL